MCDAPTNSTLRAALARSDRPRWRDLPMSLCSHRLLACTCVFVVACALLPEVAWAAPNDASANEALDEAHLDTSFDDALPTLDAAIEDCGEDGCDDGAKGRAAYDEATPAVGLVDDDFAGVGVLVLGAHGGDGAGGALVVADGQLDVVVGA